MHATGILFGLLAAVLQSGAYVFSRLFVLRREDGVIRLLITAHILMGAASLAILPLAWRPGVAAPSAWAWQALGVSGFYLLGQAGLLRVMRTTEASRVAPLLGFKIVVLAVITVGFMHRPLAAEQWLAIGLCVTAAVSLNFSGVSLSLHGVAWLLFTCINYSLSDLCIEQLFGALGLPSRFEASVLGTSISYVLCGAVALVALPLARRRIGRVDWVQALPFACCWLMAMVCLFICFGSVGAVYGNILQSTRGLFSILAGMWLASMGWFHLEQRAPGWVRVRRCAAAVLMVAAIWLFGHGRAR